MASGAWMNAQRLWAGKVSLRQGPALGNAVKHPRLRTLRNCAALLLAGALSACTASPTSDPGKASQTNRAVVERVVDGDTIRVKIGGRTETVRLIGVDTPETVARGRPVGCYGREASNFTRSRLPKGTSVNLVLDVEPRDRYERLLAYVYRSDTNAFINAELAAEGFANVLTVPPNVAHADQFVDLVATARRQQKGLWARCPDQKG